MKAADGKVAFGDWLPDLPVLDNPGLTEAKNVIPTDATYKPYLPLAGTGDALADRPQGAASALDSTNSAFLYAGTVDALYVRSGSSWTDKTPSAYSTVTTDYWRFAQFDSTLIATNYTDVPQSIEVGSGSDFADLALTGTAPKARQAGVIGRFLILGDTVDGTNGTVPNRIQWPAIDDPTNWPTPGGATALSVQSGEQFMNANYGPVQSIVGGEQFGVILQRSGITRASYIGGNVVFQFDNIEKNRGVLCPNATIQVGKLIYFIAADGFYVTDGVTVVPIGSRKVDNHFSDSFDSAYPERVYSAVDFANKILMFAYPGTTNTAGRPNRILMYNYEEHRWARAEDECEVLILGLTTVTSLDDLDDLFASIDLVTPSLDSPYWKGGTNIVMAFDSDNKAGAFSGAAGTAIIDGQEAELHPGLYTRVQGIKPLVIGTSPVMTVSLGRRDDLGTTVSYSTAVSPTARTGFCDFDLEARYNRSRLSIVGAFQSAMGVEYQAVPSGAT